VAVLTALAVTVGLMLLVAGAPVYTDDLWWHLEAGEMYATEGPWPARDWMLYTALPDAPIQHEWLFGVMVYLIDRLGGFPALRVTHVLWVALITAGFYATFRRTGASRGASALSVILMLSLAWLRLAQYRPDLVSILALLGLYHLALARDWSGAPTRRRLAILAAAGLLVAVWANFHSLVVLGINLVVAAVLGVGLQGALARFLGIGPARSGGPTPGGAETRPRLAALLGLLAVALGCAMLNPRGPAQLTTFLTSSGQSALWFIVDEWSPFNPFWPGANQDSIALLQWAGADAVLLAFALTAARRFWRLVQGRSAADLARFDAVGFGLGLAAIVALLVSIRFLWLAFLPLVYVLTGARFQGRARQAGLLVAAVVLSLWFSQGNGVAELAAKYGDDPGGYAKGYQHHRYHSEGVAFLAGADLEGRLFNPYWMGGFLGYWLAPRIQVFVDGRTEHYAYETYVDYSAVLAMKGRLPNESFLDVLERHGVDLFFGVGFPHWWLGIYTTGHLENVPGWVLVSRSYRHAIYLRRNARNRRNLERVAAYYQREGIPFDPGRGLDPNAVIARRPDWARSHGMLPPDWEKLRSELPFEAQDHRRAREVVAILYALDGAYELQTALDRETLARYPGDLDARARLVHGLLRLGEFEAARAAAAPVPALAKFAGNYIRLASAPTEGRQSARKQAALDHLLEKAFPVRAADTWEIDLRMATELPGY